MSKKKKNGLNDVIETVESAIVDDKSITNEIHLGSNSEIVIKRTIDTEKLDRYNEIMAKLGHRK